MGNFFGGRAGRVVNSPVSVQRICSKCGEFHDLKNMNIGRVAVKDENNNVYKLMYFKCRNCGELNFVQIDNSDSIKVFNTLKDLTIKTIRKKVKGETVSPKAIKRKNELEKSLKNKRQELIKSCTGKAFYDFHSGKIITEHLTFSEGDGKIDSNM